MFGRYTVPSDELAQLATSITASDEDPEYEAQNAIVHLSRRPAKLTALQGSWAMQFASPITVGVAAFIHKAVEVDPCQPRPIFAMASNHNNFRRLYFCIIVKILVSNETYFKWLEV